MKAVCVMPDRTLTIRDVPRPETPPPGHVLVDMDAATITHGDKFFLTRPMPGATGFVSDGLDVYGSNGGGRVVAVGAGVPDTYAGKQVAIYKSLARSPDTIGLWCERAQVPAASCLILPDHLRGRDYCGSFANILTVYAFLEEIEAQGHKGIIVTAGNSATGRIAASLARRRGLPAIFLVRSAAAHDDLVGHGVDHVLVTTATDVLDRLENLAGEIGATAVFDGIGGDLLNRIIPVLPLNTTVFVYGFLGGPTPIAVATTQILGRNLTLRRFSNLESALLRDPARRDAATRAIEGLIDDPLLRTRIGQAFTLNQIDAAMAYEATSGAKALLVASA